MSVKWTENSNFEVKLKELIGERLEAMSKYLNDTLYERMSRPYYPSRVASSWMEYPKWRTSVLRDSIIEGDYARHDPDDMEITVGPSIYRAPYIEHLVLRDRKFAAHLIEEPAVAETALRIFRTGS